MTVQEGWFSIREIDFPGSVYNLRLVWNVKRYFVNGAQVRVTGPIIKQGMSNKILVRATLVTLSPAEILITAQLSLVVLVGNSHYSAHIIISFPGRKCAIMASCGIPPSDIATCAIAGAFVSLDSIDLEV